MEHRPLKVVIVGHVDHGKSTLIGRLLFETDSLPHEKINEIKEVSRILGKEMELAFLMDHLKEEREKNMTIDTSQIHFKTKKRNYVIIDAPGHFEFTKNMITGASQADIALLVIDSSLGIQEQTRRHAYLLKWLGIEKLIVLLNKMDLVHYEEKIFNTLRQDIALFLERLGLVPSFVIPISSKEGLNISEISSRKNIKMSWFKGPHLLKALDLLKDSSQETETPLRLPIQDVYEKEGQKIIVGQMASGTLTQNQKIVILPSGKEATIHKIMTFDHPKKKKAISEENIGLELEWISGTPHEGKRGDMIAASPRLPTPTLKFRGNLFWMAEKPLTQGETLILRSTTQKATVTIEAIEKRMNSSTLELIENDAQELKINEAASVIFETETPLILDAFSSISETGRFVVEQNFHVQGAGTVQDSNC